MSKNVIGILGGGASGMAAAIAAVKNGAEVVIIEKLDRVGKKLLSTGNGRCNYTNEFIDINRFHSSDLKFVDEILSGFTTVDAVEFFKQLGIEPYLDETGKIFPMSLQASSMIDVMRDEYLRMGVKEICGEKVLSVTKKGDKFNVATDINSYKFDKVIITMGGKVNAKLGSDGSGFELLNKLGLKTTDIYPALVKLKSDFKHLNALKGLKINCLATLFNEEGKEISNDYGEVLFADFGISGPPVLQLSGFAVKEINEGKNVYVELDLFSDMKKNELYTFLDERFIQLKHKSVKDSFIGLIHKRIIIPILKESGIEDFDQICTKLNKKQKYDIVENLKSLKFNIKDFHSWQEAQVTAGGIILSQLDVNSMEAFDNKGLYIAGEILDVYGDCGGFNLHWAWATGIKAGKLAAMSFNNL